MMSNVTTLPRPLTGGGHVMAIVPQTFEETYRVAKAVYMGGLAPAALIGKLEGDAAISAVTVAIMSGAELGLQPMVALRSFTVINGKPALYGDGLINVVRMSGRVAYLRTGCDERDGQMIGWCEAKRNDTGEDKRVEFSQEDAVRAGLWQTEAIVTKWNKWDKKNEQKPNDSPWFRFPKRMLAWRAAGYCLRELFGDVLGGIRDEFEAREIAEVEDMRDVTPAALTPPSPPSPPSPTAAPAAELDEPTIDEQPEAVTGEQDFDAAAFFEDLEIAMAAAKDPDDIDSAWSDLDVEATLTSDELNLEVANKIKARALKRVSTPQPPSPPQDDMFPGDRQ